jgi:antirestriction protein ArdC
MARDLYSEVTSKILDSLEKGVAPWVRPWKQSERFGGFAYNAISGKPYRGINVALLYAPHYPRAGWMTFKQALDVGANVRKGERSSLIVFFKKHVVKERNAATGEDKEKTIPLLRAFNVFNLDQVDNLPAKFAPAEDTRSEFERHEHAEKLLAQASVTHGGDRAFYSPSADVIRLPQPSQFDNPACYYATGLHELTHWTGHTKRLAREYGKRFGDSAYAREELVAEMGAAFLCAHSGIAAKLQHAEYIGSWIKTLKEDKRAVLVAASAAQRAADFVMQGAGMQSASDEKAA